MDFVRIITIIGIITVVAINLISIPYWRRKNRKREEESEEERKIKEIIQRELKGFFSWRSVYDALREAGYSIETSKENADKYAFSVDSPSPSIEELESEN